MMGYDIDVCIEILTDEGFLVYDPGDKRDLEDLARDVIDIIKHTDDLKRIEGVITELYKNISLIEKKYKQLMGGRND